MAFQSDADFVNGDDSMDWGDGADEVVEPPAPEVVPVAAAPEPAPAPATPPAVPAIVYTLYQVRTLFICARSALTTRSSAARANLTATTHTLFFSMEPPLLSSPCAGI